MSKVELKLEIDAELVERLQTAGIDPLKAAEAGMRIAVSSGRVPFWLDLNGSARRKAKDPEGAERRAREWADANRDAIDEFNRHVEEHGLLSDHEPFKPKLAAVKQFDIFENPSSGAGPTPFVVVLTSHHLELEAVLVAPMIRRRLAVDRAELLLPFGSEDYIVSLISIAAIDPKRLRRNIGSLAEHEDVIQRALQRLFTGF